MAESQTLVQQFHDVINQDVNWKSRSRDQQVAITQRWLQSQYPQYATIPETTPQGRSLRERFSSEFLDDALQPTFGEKAQKAAEDWMPAVLGGLATGSMPWLRLFSPGGPGRLIGQSLVGGGVSGVTQLLAQQARPFTTTLPPPPVEGSLGQAAETAAGTAVINIPVGLGSALVGLGRQAVLAPSADTIITREARAALESPEQRGFWTRAGQRLLGLEVSPPKVALGLSQLTREDQLPFFARILDPITEAGVGAEAFTGKRIAEVKNRVGELAAEAQEKLVPHLTTTTELGESVVKGYDLAKYVAELVGGNLYKVVDRLKAANVTVSTRETLALLGEGPDADLVAFSFKVPQIREGGNIVDMGYALKEGLLELAHSGQQFTATGVPIPVATFHDAQRIRSALLETYRGYRGSKDLIEQRAAGIAKKMADALQDDMDKAAKGLSQQALEQYTHARTFWREEVIGKFENDLVTGLVRDLRVHPSNVASILMHEDKFDVARALAKADPDRWNQVRNYMIHEFIDRSISKSSELVGLLERRVNIEGGPRKIDGDALINNFMSLGRSYSTFLFEGTTLPEMRRFAMALEAAERKPKDFGKVAVQLGQASAILGSAGVVYDVATGQTPHGEYIGILAGPAALGYVLSRRQMLRNIADGILGGRTELVARTIAFANAQAFAEEARDQAAALRLMGSPITDLLPAGPRFTQGGPSSVPNELRPGYDELRESLKQHFLKQGYSEANLEKTGYLDAMVGKVQKAQAAQAAPRPPVEPPSISTLPDLSERLLKPWPFFLSAE